MYSTELDIAHDCPQNVLSDMAAKYGLTYKIVMELGPGGGNPIYEFSASTYEALSNFVLNEMCLGDEEEFEELFKDYITPVN